MASTEAIRFRELAQRGSFSVTGSCLSQSLAPSVALRFLSRDRPFPSLLAFAQIYANRKFIDIEKIVEGDAMWACKSQRVFNDKLKDRDDIYVAEGLGQ